MRRIREAASVLFDNPILIGTITILVVAIAVYLSYIAENGLPFVPTYNVNVDVANADELVKNADVRIGGARVGQVLTITPEPATKTWPHPYAQLGLSLQTQPRAAAAGHPLPGPAGVGARRQVRRAASPARSHRRGLPDGGTFTLNTNPRLNHDLPFVDLDTALQTFGPKTAAGRCAARSPSSATRSPAAGSQLNDIDPLAGASCSDRSQTPAAACSPTRAPASAEFDQRRRRAPPARSPPVAPTINSLLSNSATTFAALDRPALGQTIDQLPADRVARRRRCSPTRCRCSPRPPSDRAGAASRGAPLLPTGGARGSTRSSTGATPVFQARPDARVRRSRGRSARSRRWPATPPRRQTFKVLGSNDLATFGASAFVGLGAILRTVAPAQFACNVAGLWVRNFASALSEGDSTGAVAAVRCRCSTRPRASSGGHAVARPAPQLLPDRELEPVPGRQRGLHGQAADRQPAEDLDRGRQHGAAARACWRAGKQGGAGAVRAPAARRARTPEGRHRGAACIRSRSPRS